MPSQAHLPKRNEYWRKSLRVRQTDSRNRLSSSQRGISGDLFMWHLERWQSWYSQHFSRWDQSPIVCSHTDTKNGAHSSFESPKQNRLRRAPAGPTERRRNGRPHWSLLIL